MTKFDREVKEARALYFELLVRIQQARNRAEGLGAPKLNAIKKVAYDHNVSRSYLSRDILRRHLKDVPEFKAFLGGKEIYGISHPPDIPTNK